MTCRKKGSLFYLLNPSPPPYLSCLVELPLFPFFRPSVLIPQEKCYSFRFCFWLKRLVPRRPVSGCSASTRPLRNGQPGKGKGDPARHWTYQSHQPPQNPTPKSQPQTPPATQGGVGRKAAKEAKQPSAEQKEREAHPEWCPRLADQIASKREALIAWQDPPRDGKVRPWGDLTPI